MALLTADQLAEYAGCSLSAIHLYRRKGLIAGVAHKDESIMPRNKHRIFYDESIVDRVKNLLAAGRDMKSVAASRKSTKPGNWDKPICDGDCALCFAMRRESMPSVRSSWPTSSKDEYVVTAMPYRPEKDRTSDIAFMSKGGNR